MKAFVLVTGSDTAGTSVRLAQAFSRHPTDWQARAMATSTNYIDYPVDIPYTREALLAEYDQADLVMLNSIMTGHAKFDRNQGKPTVLMHHGIHKGHFRLDVYGCVAEAAQYRATQVGSTVNLELLGPVQWLPTAYDLPALADMRARLYEPHPLGRIRIGHAPTDRAVKSTEAVIAAVESLAARGLPVDLVLIEGRTWAETMRLKARYVDVLVDQLHLGYGCNAIEAWALGIPVVGGISDPAWRAHAVARYGLTEAPGGLPMAEATEDTLEAVLAAMVGSEAMRRDWRAVGMLHVKRHHSEPSVTALASAIWSEAVQRRTVKSPPRYLPATTFRQVPRIPTRQCARMARSRIPVTPQRP